MSSATTENRDEMEIKNSIKVKKNKAQSFSEENNPF